MVLRPDVLLNTLALLPSANHYLLPKLISLMTTKTEVIVKKKSGILESIQ